jgi:hypothetical protein
MLPNQINNAYLINGFGQKLVFPLANALGGLERT